MTHLVIIGGSDAGISAGLRAREIDPTSRVTIIVADRFPNYSVCGIPYYFSREVPDYHNLAHRTADDITAKGIDLLLAHTAQHIDPAAKTVSAVDEAGQQRTIPYDKLVIGTGADAIKPAISGIDLEGVFLLRTMPDTLAIDAYMAARQPQSVAIIGGGYIGLEMAEALTERGLQVTLLERSATVLKTLDAELGALVQAELTRRGVAVHPRIDVTQIARDGEALRVRGADGFSRAVDMVLVSVGVTPQTDLAAAAGIELGLRGAIKVNPQMATNQPGIYAAGDCIETWHRLLNEYTYLPLGSTAHKQGRVAGENAVGGAATFAGTLGTQVVKIFDLVAARTGLRDDEAQAAGFDPLSITFAATDHKIYYPGAHELAFRITGDRASGRLLGAQIVGHKHGAVAKRIDIYAAALYHGMTVSGVSDLDLSYTPPLGSPWDAVQMAAQAWEAAARVTA
ncbi:MAG: FAD-dependent oxidoreductase [Chloroflexi bacterium]|nr:FAD-dependent oxidoreductase [Chloroflexota bacterium]